MKKAAAVFRIFPFAILAIGLQHGVVLANVPSREAIVAELTGVLRWEMLWFDSPTNFSVSPKRSALFAIYATANTVAYCSHDVRACAEYRVLGHRNWMRDTSLKCDDHNTDLDALRAFIGKRGREERWIADPAQGLQNVPHLPMDTDVGIWSARLTLGSRAEIVTQYKQRHSVESEGLEKELRRKIRPQSGVKSVTIACSFPTDPIVSYSIRRRKGELIIMMVFWDKEEKKWTIASSLERAQNPAVFGKLLETIESVACSKIVF